MGLPEWLIPVSIILGTLASLFAVISGIHTAARLFKGILKRSERTRMPGEAPVTPFSPPAKADKRKTAEVVNVQTPSQLTHLDDFPTGCVMAISLVPISAAAVVAAPITAFIYVIAMASVGSFEPWIGFTVFIIAWVIALPTLAYITEKLSRRLAEVSAILALSVTVLWGVVNAIWQADHIPNTPPDFPIPLPIPLTWVFLAGFPLHFLFFWFCLKVIRYAESPKS